MQQRLKRRGGPVCMCLVYVFVMRDESITRTYTIEWGLNVHDKNAAFFTWPRRHFMIIYGANISRDKRYRQN